MDDILRRGYLDEKQRDGLVADQLAILGFTALLGGLLLSYAQRRRTRVRQPPRLVADGGSSTADGLRTLSGPVELDSLATPQRRPPEHYDSAESADTARRCRGRCR